MRKLIQITAIFFIAISFYILNANAAAPGEPTRCTMCHENSGAGNNPYIPRLAGQTEKYFVNEIKAYQNHLRSSADAKFYMWGYAEELNDSDVQKIAKWFAGQTPGKGIAGDAILIKKGEEIFQNGIPEKNVDSCTACHGALGQGKGVNPRLAGQFASYLSSQLFEFSRGTMQEAKVMPDIVSQLTNDEILALAEYLQSL